MSAESGVLSVEVTWGHGAHSRCVTLIPLGEAGVVHMCFGSAGGDRLEVGSRRGVGPRKRIDESALVLLGGI